jgi:hypothetical protein
VEQISIVTDSRDECLTQNSKEGQNSIFRSSIWRRRHHMSRIRHAKGEVWKGWWEMTGSCSTMIADRLDEILGIEPWIVTHGICFDSPVKLASILEKKRSGERWDAL